jgi:hypothetical protein
MAIIIAASEKITLENLRRHDRDQALPSFSAVFCSDGYWPLRPAENRSAPSGSVYTAFT